MRGNRLVASMFQPGYTVYQKPVWEPSIGTCTPEKLDGTGFNVDAF